MSRNKGNDKAKPKSEDTETQIEEVVKSDVPLKSRKARAPKRSTRRMDTNVKAGVKNVLTIDPSILDEKNFEYRIVNMEPGNIERKQAKDWDIAHIDEDVKVGDDVAGKSQPKGSTTEIHAGGGMKAILMCKRKDWCDADRAAKEALLQEKQDRMQSDYKEKHEPIKEE